MSFRELTLEAYSKHHRLLKSKAGDLPLVPFLDYKGNDHDIDDRETNIHYFIYNLQETDFTREIINLYNLFAYWVNKLHTWEQVLREYGEDDAQELRYEFTRLPFDHCLHFPYQFKSKLIFCSTRLCYTRAITKEKICQKDVERDNEINMDSLIKAVEPWSSGEELIKSIYAMDGKEFRQEIRNYRNKAQHRHAPCLEFGHILEMNLSFPKGYSYSFAMQQLSPVRFQDIIPTFISESEKARTAFSAYRQLIAEHWGECS